MLFFGVVNKCVRDLKHFIPSINAFASTLEHFSTWPWWREIYLYATDYEIFSGF